MGAAVVIRRLLWLSVPAFGTLLSAQTPMSPLDLQRQSVALMRQGVQAQQASVKRQVQTVRRDLPAAAPTSFPPLAPTPASWPPACAPVPADTLDDIVRESSEREGVANTLVRAVIAQESAAYPCAVSAKGARGLMQLMPQVGEHLGVTNAFDPQQNVAAGTKLLKQLMDRYNGDVRLALSAYNAGPARVDQAGGVPAIPETQHYVETILQHLTPVTPVFLPSKTFE